MPLKGRSANGTSASVGADRPWTDREISSLAGCGPRSNYDERPGPYSIIASTAKSVFVDMLTTILGLGALMVASHKGLESLGRALTLSVTTCTLTSLVFLPVILWILRPPGVVQPSNE